VTRVRGNPAPRPRKLNELEAFSSRFDTHGLPWRAAISGIADVSEAGAADCGSERGERSFGLASKHTRKTHLPMGRIAHTVKKPWGCER
jgi:hypothetical protein